MFYKGASFFNAVLHFASIYHSLLLSKLCFVIHHTLWNVLNPDNGKFRIQNLTDVLQRPWHWWWYDICCICSMFPQVRIRLNINFLNSSIHHLHYSLCSTVRGFYFCTCTLFTPQFPIFSTCSGSTPRTPQKGARPYASHNIVEGLGISPSHPLQSRAGFSPSPQDKDKEAVLHLP